MNNSQHDFPVGTLDINYEDRTKSKNLSYTVCTPGGALSAEACHPFLNNLYKKVYNLY